VSGFSLEIFQVTEHGEGERPAFKKSWAMAKHFLARHDFRWTGPISIRARETVEINGLRARVGNQGAGRFERKSIIEPLQVVFGAAGSSSALTASCFSAGGNPTPRSGYQLLRGFGATSPHYTESTHESVVTEETSLKHRIRSAPPFAHIRKQPREGHSAGE